MTKNRGKVDSPSAKYPRLLSLLSLIEAALSSAQGRPAAVTRSADYRMGVARMTVGDGSGSILLQNFLLADGQLCMRINLRRTGAAQAGEEAIYPQVATFDWEEAAARIARAWCVLAPAETGRAETISA